jgi:hypothetical protein
VSVQLPMDNSIQLAKINVQLVDCGKTLQPIISGRYTLQLSIVPGVKYTQESEKIVDIFLR